jgi:nitronate monooxygenase
MTNPRLPAVLQNLVLPVVAAPMFIASTPKLVIEQMQSGIVGSFPALNARPQSDLDKWLTQIQSETIAFQKENPNKIVGPLAVNQIVHHTNERLRADVEVCVGHKVPIFITSLRAPPKEIIDAVHSYGGVVFHDVINVRHAKKALEAGVDGLILVAVGAGGHAGPYSPLSIVSEVRKFFNGPILLSGCISTGRHVLSAQAMGADLAYLGTRFLATPEANVTQQYKECIVNSTAADIVYTSYFTGVKGNYLRQSIINQGLDPDNLPEKDASTMQFGSKTEKEVLDQIGSGDTLNKTTTDAPADTLKSKKDRPSQGKAWKDFWGAGTGVGTIDDSKPTREVVDQLIQEYREAKNELIKFSSQY